MTTITVTLEYSESKKFRDHWSTATALPAVKCDNIPAMQMGELNSSPISIKNTDLAVVSSMVQKRTAEVSH